MTTNQQHKQIPTLRFPEFMEEWKEKKLGDLCTKIGSGSTPKGGEEVYQKAGIPFIRSQNVINNKLIVDNTCISDEINQKMKGSIVKANDVLLNITGGSIGRSCVVPENFKIGNVNQHVSIIRLEKNSSKFLQSILSSFRGQKLIFRGQTGSGREGLNFQSIRCFKISFPQLQEQKKIASFLTSVDKKISQLQNKKDLLQDYKKGVMQQIFPSTGSGQVPELRFKPALSGVEGDDNGNDYPDWEEKKLGALCNIKTGKLDANAMVENGAYRFYTCARNYYQIDNYSFDTEALLISGNGANVGYIHYYKGKFNAYQRTYVLDEFNENIHYLKCFLDKNLYERISNEKKDGNTPYIVLSTLKDMIVKLPEAKEQTKIANFLTAIDTKIELVNTQLKNTQQFKKGLLQHMFV